MAYKIYDSYHVHGIVVHEYMFTLPLDYARPDGDTITVFARRVVPYDEASVDDADACKRPFMVYLQGGPGFQCDAPLTNSGRIREVLDKGYQLINLDQRGTGFSSPITPATLERLGSDAAKADYLAQFRADNIVRDCEEIRKALTKTHTAKQWSLLGQSFGGFCAVTYLSFYPASVKDVLITGGLPPLVDGPDAVYAALYERMKSRNRAYYAKYPKDVARVRAVLAHLAAHDVRLPSGGALTVDRFQQLGIEFGRHQGIDAVHQLVSRCAYELELVGSITYATLYAVDAVLALDTNVLYACMHEAIYCQGRASRWAAERLRRRPENAEFVYAAAADAPVFFTGEMIFRSMFDDFAQLRPLKPVAELLAAKADWPPLYDRAALARCPARVAAVSYFNDPYVDVDLSVAAARAIAGCRQWVTSEFLHNGIGVNPGRVLGELFKLLQSDVE
ncbi:Alpha/Beta hydrolase protein [Dipodascopsis tothii]|uniref:Alpha/Beta hydrolase protein n=1 Tax=Dipodascopsis tothii TaxID=44089 RepID=UPI0034CED1AE